MPLTSPPLPPTPAVYPTLRAFFLIYLSSFRILKINIIVFVQGVPAPSHRVAEGYLEAGLLFQECKEGHLSGNQKRKTRIVVSGIKS
jgi:hypothetical protein